MMNLGFVEITLLCSLFVSFRIDSVSSLNSDGLVLLSLLNHFDKIPPQVNSTWTPETTPCNNWFGVFCDYSGNVDTLNLSKVGFSGQLGPEIGELKSLVTLDLSANTLSGPLPSSLGNCTSLLYLDLSENGFSGEIPDIFSSLKNLKFVHLTSNFFIGGLPQTLFQLPLLRVLNLESNNLSGLIPASVGGLKELVDLTLSQNDLSGSIPESIGNCSKLEYLVLSENKLNGSLPESLNLLENLHDLFLSSNRLAGRLRFGSSNCKKLVTLDMSYNDFEGGGVPPEIGNCSNLELLFINKCNLIGNIPSSLGMLKKVRRISLSDNLLSGNIPDELGNCSSLETLTLGRNQLQGEIPSTLGKLKKLKWLELYDNNLSGEIPIGVWKIQSLTQIIVYSNTLTGELPVEVTELKHLERLMMFDNRFHGAIPMGLGVNRSIVDVDLVGNGFTGEIPPNLCHGHKLRFFNLGSNQLHGKIPPSVGRCKTVKRILLGGNKLSGVLPEFLEMHSLEYVDFKDNNIEGSIPRSLGSCKNLMTINLSQNKLTGLIPPELGNLQSLGKLYLSHNHLEGPLPPQLSVCVRILEFDVGSNSLNGSVPPSFGSWRSLTTLVLSDNRFSGAIPSFLAELIDLRLARNGFGGEIPSSLGLLKNLNGLDLSGNELTGEIPTTLRGLVSLVRLNISNNKLTGPLSVLQNLSLLQLDVSNNQLTGPIPEKLIKNSTTFLGNADLCIIQPNVYSVMTRNEFKTCKGRQAKLSTWKIALIAVGSFLSAFALVFFALALVFLCCKRGANKTEDAHVLDDEEEEGLSLLLNKVLAATDNLDDKYIIGRGAHGVVYKASLGPGDEYAVKKLIFAAEHVHTNQNMKREIETIGLVRHRNLVRLERFWITKENGLLLYKYMPNGSLHDVLHRGGGTRLDWSARFNVALGIAHGLAYLHHDCYPPIIHRDIKPENILMDSEMEPHIGDFGLARILDDSAISTSTITGTTGYIAPENAYRTVRGKESDVYSYGVVLLELVTGKRAVDRSLPEETDLVSWVRSVLSSYEDDTVGPVVDPTLVDELMDAKLREQAILLTDLALQCTDKRPGNRPSMRNVVKELTDVKDLVRITPGSV
ncbi:unnamed protein product [Brassica napus]|uniref:non-specific serine/threonine protein kinase n=1 Tax=Brassica napus TaxID=3708 RepID=A0A816QQL9_BRANA|nr:unnamed protein product [Brassica napus]